MSFRLNRLVLAIIAIVAILGTFFGFSAVNNVAEAGGGPSNIRLEVKPSTKTSTGGWTDTVSYIRSVESVQLLKAYWYKYISGGSPITYTFGPDGSETHMQGDPSNIYYPTGMYLAYPDGTKNAFASAQWFSTTDSCDAPRMTISVTNPRTVSANAKGVVDNRDGRLKLFVSENGGSWTDIPIGDFYATSTRQVSEIRVSVDGSNDSWKQCARLNWNTTPAWIESPKATPSPTPSPTPRSVTITAPNGGEVLTVGETYRIRWTSNRVSNVMIGYSFGVGSLNWITSGLVPNQGYYDWKVGIGNRGTPSSQVKISITGYENGVGSSTDDSDNFFTVTAAPTPTPAPKKTVVFAVDPASASVEVGKTVDIGIKVDTQGQTVGGVEFRLKFDPTVLSFEQSFNPPTESCGMNNAAGSNQAGLINYAVLTDKTLKCTLTVVRFKALKAGQTPLTLVKEWTLAIDTSSNELTLERKDGQVTVAPPKK